MTEPTTIEPEKADVYALMRLHIRGDEEGINTIINLIGAYPLCAMLCQIAVDLGAELYGGEEELDERLRHWLATRDE